MHIYINTVTLDALHPLVIVHTYHSHICRSALYACDAIKVLVLLYES